MAPMVVPKYHSISISERGQRTLEKDWRCAQLIQMREPFRKYQKLDMRMYSAACPSSDGDHDQWTKGAGSAL